MRRMRVPHQLKSVFIEVVVITIGLLIALAIDNLVEWRQQQNLAAEARKGLRAEITKNVATIDESVGEIDQALQQMRADLAALRPFQRSRDTPKSLTGLAIKVGYFSHLLKDTSWKTSQATGTLSYMPYDEAQLYSTIYALQARFSAEEQIIGEDIVQLLALKDQLDDGSLLLAAADASTAVHSLGVMRGHLAMLKGSALAASAVQHAFLEGRPPEFSIDTGKDLDLQ
jgi:hypothetical protein